jgi:hypothetical protein
VVGTGVRPRVSDRSLRELERVEFAVPGLGLEPDLESFRSSRGVPGRCVCQMEDPMALDPGEGAKCSEQQVMQRGKPPLSSDGARSAGPDTMHASCTVWNGLTAAYVPQSHRPPGVDHRDGMLGWARPSSGRRDAGLRDGSGSERGVLRAVHT